jgi:transposase-like protein
VRVRGSAAAGLALVQQWRSSGQTPAQFCRSHGIGAHRLHYWKRKSDVERAPEPSVAGKLFALSAPVRADAGEPERGEAEVRLEIQRLDGIVVRLAVAAESADFAHTLRAVLQVLAP